MQKIKLIVILSLLLLTVPTRAQFQFGVTGGMNISQLRVSDDTYKGYMDKIRPGFIIGPTLIYTIPKTGLGFDVSALYDLRGARSRSLKDCESIYCKSFQFPINIRYGLEFGDMLYGFVFTGPQFGLSLGSKDRFIVSGTSKTTGHALERRWVSNNSTFSWSFGVGGIVLEKVQVRIIYNLALRETGEIQQVDLDDSSSHRLTSGKASACQIALSYLF